MTIENSFDFEDLASGSGKQTLIKTTLRNQINLVSISDQKANMLLSINAIILSIVITLSSAKLVISLDDFFASTLHLIPVTMLLLTCLASGVLCIYAATPPAASKELEDDIGIMMLNTKDKITGADEFLQEIGTILKSNELLYKNLCLDIYQLGSLLTRKYKLLRFAYYSFFVGITLSVLFFIILINI